MNEMGL